MVLLKVLAGGKAGTAAVARRFPFRVGRAPGADLRLETPGVWEQQFEINSALDDGIVLTSQPPGLTLVNGQPVTRVVLRSGDRIECGEARLQFWLSAARQRGLRMREVATWLGLAALGIAQVFLCWWLSQ